MFTFETTFKTLERAGYRCAHNVLNACHFGAPQNRARILIAYRANTIRATPEHPRATTPDGAPSCGVE